MPKTKIIEGTYQMPKEFTPIPGHHNYGISKYGRVFSRKTGIIMKTNLVKYIRKDGTCNTQYIRSMVHIHTDEGKLVTKSIKALLAMTFETFDYTKTDRINRLNRYLIKNIPIEEDEKVKSESEHDEESEDDENEEDEPEIKVTPKIEITKNKDLLFNKTSDFTTGDQEYVHMDNLEVKVQKQIDLNGNKYYNVLLKIKC